MKCNECGAEFSEQWHRVYDNDGYCRVWVCDQCMYNYIESNLNEKDREWIKSLYFPKTKTGFWKSLKNTYYKKREKKESIKAILDFLKDETDKDRIEYLLYLLEIERHTTIPSFWQTLKTYITKKRRNL